MKRIFVMALVFTAVSTYGQTPISSNRIEGSSIVLNNMSRSDVDKIMQGTIFDVFTLDLREYNTDLRKAVFLDTDRAREYQERLANLRNRLNSQGIRTLPLSRGMYTSDYVSGISNYDVNRGGFDVFLNYNAGYPHDPGIQYRIRTPNGWTPEGRGITSNSINGFSAYFDLFEHQIRKHLNKNVETLEHFRVFKTPMGGKI